MYELDIIRHLTEKAAKENALKYIFEVLTLRLQPDTALRFKLALEQIDDLERLEVLLRAAVLANTPEDFEQVLEENGN